MAESKSSFTDKIGYGCAVAVVTVVVLLIIGALLGKLDKHGTTQSNLTPVLILKVTSNTSWSGFFNNRSVDGKGDETFDIDKYDKCWSLQKETERGTLTLEIYDKANMESIAENYTTASYGIVRVCR